VRTDDGYEVTLERNDYYSFVKDSLTIKVTKTVKYAQMQIIPIEVAKHYDAVAEIIEQMKQQIEDTINVQKAR
jgi:adenosine deaminase